MFFNDPVAVANHELQAVRFALAAQGRLAQVAEGWRKRGTELALGVGIDAGYATLGRIGFEGRYDYAAVGPSEPRLTAQYPCETRPDPHRPAPLRNGQDAVEATPAGELELKGFARPVPAYEVLGLR